MNYRPVPDDMLEKLIDKSKGRPSWGKLPVRDIESMAYEIIQRRRCADRNRIMETVLKMENL